MRIFFIIISCVVRFLMHSFTLTWGIPLYSCGRNIAFNFKYGPKSRAFLSSNRIAVWVSDAIVCRWKILRCFFKLHCYTKSVTIPVTIVAMIGAIVRLSLIQCSKNTALSFIRCNKNITLSTTHSCIITPPIF